jgi:N-acetyl-anhydromuramyl-L-alanine amidase AmpD
MAWRYSDELKARTGNGWSDEPEPETSRLAIPEKTSPNSSPRGSAPVRLVILHTAEGARTVAELGNYFAAAAVQVSSHVGIDDDGIEQYVDYAREAWTTRNANPISDNAELCGFAAWTREQWINDHMSMLKNAASWVAARCTARNIPVVKLTPAQVAAGQPGVCGHVDWTVGMKDGTHTDPGPGFPWDVVISLAQGGGVPVAQDVTARQVDEIHQQLLGVLPAWPGGITDDKSTPYNMLQHLLRVSVSTNQSTLMLAQLLKRAQAKPPGMLRSDVNEIAATIAQHPAIAALADSADDIATVSFWKATAERVVRAFAVSMLSLLGAGVIDIVHVSWTTDLSISGGAAVASLLASLVASQVGAKGSPSFLKGNS